MLRRGPSDCSDSCVDPIVGYCHLRSSVLILDGLWQVEITLLSSFKWG